MLQIPLMNERSIDSPEAARRMRPDRALGDFKPKKILAVASGGGHWVQLLRMAPAFNDHTVVFVSTQESHRVQVQPSRFYIVKDGNRWQKVRLLRMAAKLLFIMVRERPDIVVSTGAAPGYFGLRFGKMMGARTIWVDSIANAERLSLSGQHAGRFADLWLTQWAHLAKPRGPLFKGSVI